MNNNRKSELVEKMKGLGTVPGGFYTNQEIIDRLGTLQSALATGVFEKTHADNLRDMDVMLHFAVLAKEYGLEETETYARFQNGMKTLSYTIGSLKKGKSGERAAKRALKILNYERGTRILYNVQLEDSEAKAEYDAIVVTPYGMFVIEVKNWGAAVTINPKGKLIREDDTGVVYDLQGRISMKEALLHECLGDKFPSRYETMLLFTNEKVCVNDEFHKVPVSCGGGIGLDIKGYSSKGPILTTEQVDEIVEMILASNKEQRTRCMVPCDQIIEDYAVLMAEIEHHATVEQVTPEAEKVIMAEPVEEQLDSVPTPENPVVKWLRDINWCNVVASAAIALAMGVLSARASHQQ